MRRTIRACGNIILVGLAPAFWCADADAYLLPPTCPPGEYYEPPGSYYTPARYTTGAAGDVAVNTLPTSNASTMQQLVGAVVGALTGGGPVYIHTKLLTNIGTGFAIGSSFTETFPGDPMPPTSYATGEPHPCSKVMSPWFLSRLWPGTVGGLLYANTWGGTGQYFEDAEPGILVKAFGSTNCTGVPLDSYHLHSVLDDNIKGGSCEKLLVDYCGVPVSSTLDRTKYTAQESTNAINALFTDVYGYCMGEIGSQWPGWPGCGNTSEQVACARAAWQIVNEAYYTAGPDFWDDGWSDYDVVGSIANPLGPYPPANYNATSGTLMGASKSNQGDTSTGALCPGFCNDGTCDTYPTGNWSCPGSAYQPTSIVANIPQNIINAATRLKATQQNVQVGSGITAGYMTRWNGGCVP
jgi:hypothetical protein